VSRPSLTTMFARALQDRTDCAVVLAVSGGPDSMALLSAAAYSKLTAKNALRFVACGIDHGRRPAAKAELELARELAALLGIPFVCRTVTVAHKGNLHANARKARYDALANVAHEHCAKAIATGHHADDQAETVLIRLLRGSGARGLAAMRSVSVVPGHASLQLLRPLLQARRSDVELHIRRHAIRVAQDPSNADPRFLRTRVRHEVLPLLERLNPGVVAHINALAEELQRIRINSDFLPEWSRAHRHAIAALPKQGRGAEVRLPGGLVLRYERPAK
jgi:tRNA(Ile)-lysidine synthase